MKGNLLLLFFVGTVITDGFVTTRLTDADNQSIVIPIIQQYAGENDYTVDWGDGTMANHQTGNATHAYATQGAHTVTIIGDFAAIEMYNTINITGNNQKLLTAAIVGQWYLERHGQCV